MDTHADTPIDPRFLGARLQEARKARHMTQHQAAESLGLARTTVVAIEKGERHVQPSELIRLANLYGRQINDLLRRQDVSQSFVVQFRAVQDRDAATKVAIATDEQEDQVVELQRLCEDYYELERLCSSPLPRRYPDAYPIGGGRPEQLAEDIASAERNRLGLGDGPVLNLREVLENDVGLRVFYMKMPSRMAGMCGYTSELGGCMAVNAKHPLERRRWSLLHEYAHFLTKRYQPDISIVFLYQRVPAHERFADAFARCFLMPAAGLSRRFGALRNQKRGAMTIADLLTLADLYEVSFEALIGRLEELRLIAVGTWNRLRDEGFKVREAQQMLGLTVKGQASDDELLPLRYQYLAVQAFDDERLTEGQLARFLRTDRLGAREVVSGLKVRPDIVAAGEAGELPIDFSIPIELA